MTAVMDDALRGVTRRVVIACRTCGFGWTEDAEAACSNPDHEHVRHERHRHRTPVSLPSGAEIWAVSFEEDDPYTREVPPQFGLYLDEKWGPPWEHAHLSWPDFGVPSDDDALRQLLGRALKRAKAGDRVEIGCWGAHGRTGTAIGCLAILDGQAANGAVAWVRTNYCERAIETPEQEAFVAAFTG